MPEYLQDPSVLTKERLKTELLAHSVRLPLGDQRKDVYVQLYLKHLTARNSRRSPDFSSDEEEGLGSSRPHRVGGYPNGIKLLLFRLEYGLTTTVEEVMDGHVIMRMESGIKKSTKKTDKTNTTMNNFIDVTQMTNENLREQLMKYGYSVGPIVDTTRKVYERKLEQLMDQASAVTEENQSSGSTDSDQFSDTEEEVIAAKELFPTKTKTPVTRQRKTDSSQVDQEEVVKDNLLEEMPPIEAPTFTGISATCRKPIRGAAGRPIEFTYKDTLPKRPVAQLQPLAQVKPEKSKSRRSMPIWIQIVVLLIVAFFLFLVYQAMETNKGNPFPMIPEVPRQEAGSQ